jgi:hypothetical protein
MQLISNVRHSYKSGALQVLPLAIRDYLNEEVQQAVIKVNRVFQRLCAREITIVD